MPRTRPTEDKDALPDGFEEAFTRLLEASARSTNRCLAAKVVALGDEAVRRVLARRGSGGERVRGVSCRGDIVMITFDPPAGSVRLTSESLQVSVDLSGGHVIDIRESAEVDDDESNLGGLRLDALGTDLESTIHEFRPRSDGESSVDLKLTGGLRRARAYVEGTPVTLRPISGGAAGKARVILTPNHIDVDLELVTGPWVTVSVALKIGGKEVTKSVYSRGGATAERVQFGFDEFGLTTPRV